MSININESVQTELSQLVEDYFIITKEISEKMSIIEKLNEKLISTKTNGTLDKGILGELKKETYLYQFLNVFLVKVISNIKLLYKLSKIASIELEKEYEGRIVSIMESDPDSMTIENGKVIIVDETLQTVLDNSIKEISKEEMEEVLKQQIENLDNTETSNEESK